MQPTGSSLPYCARKAPPRTTPSAFTDFRARVRQDNRVIADYNRQAYKNRRLAASWKHLFPQLKKDLSTQETTLRSLIADLYVAEHKNLLHQFDRCLIRLSPLNQAHGHSDTAGARPKSTILAAPPASTVLNTAVPPFVLAIKPSCPDYATVLSATATPFVPTVTPTCPDNATELKASSPPCVSPVTTSCPENAGHGESGAATQRRRTCSPSAKRAKGVHPQPHSGATTADVSATVAPIAPLQIPPRDDAVRPPPTGVTQQPRNTLPTHVYTRTTQASSHHKNVRPHQTAHTLTGITGTSFSMPYPPRKCSRQPTVTHPVLVDLPKTLRNQDPSEDTFNKAMEIVQDFFASATGDVLSTNWVNTSISYIGQTAPHQSDNVLIFGLTQSQVMKLTNAAGSPNTYLARATPKGKPPVPSFTFHVVEVTPIQEIPFGQRAPRRTPTEPKEGPPKAHPPGRHPHLPRERSKKTKKNPFLLVKSLYQFHHIVNIHLANLNPLHLAQIKLLQLHLQI